MAAGIGRVPAPRAARSAWTPTLPVDQVVARRGAPSRRSTTRSRRSTSCPGWRPTRCSRTLGADPARAGGRRLVPRSPASCSARRSAPAAVADGIAGLDRMVVAHRRCTRTSTRPGATWRCRSRRAWPGSWCGTRRSAALRPAGAVPVRLARFAYPLAAPHPAARSWRSMWWLDRRDRRRRAARRSSGAGRRLVAAVPGAARAGPALAGYVVDLPAASSPAWGVLGEDRGRDPAAADLPALLAGAVGRRPRELVPRAAVLRHRPSTRAGGSRWS